MDLQRVYKFSYNYLLEKALGYITEDRINAFISECDGKNCNSLIDVYELLLAMLQDYNRFPNVIKFYDRKNEMKRILHNFDLEYIADQTPEKLLSAFKNEFGFEKDKLWLRYTKGVISGAKFMLAFSSFDEFKSIIDYFDENDMTREALALYLPNKIHNMGFAIACNWLKELGYSHFAKPDTHTKDICAALGLSSPQDDIGCFEAMAKIAREASVKEYTVDKVWWAICSGKFYRDGVELPDAGSSKLKRDFILALKKEFHPAEL